MIYYVYGGSYTDEKHEAGICLMELDTEKKKLIKLESYAQAGENPSFLAIDKDLVYSVSEMENHGMLTAFRRDGKTGRLQKLNSVETKGTAMCHVRLWPNRNFVSAANYKSGSLLVCSLQSDGSLGEICDFKQHEGKGFDPERQEAPHVHSSVVSNDQRRLYAADLGLDRVFCYEIAEDGSLSLGSESMQISAPAGTGPRHFVFSEDEHFLYLATEMGNRLLVYETNDAGKSWVLRQDLALLSEGYDSYSIAADIHFSADKKYIYASNRGANNIAAFRVDEKSNMLSCAGHYDCYGDWPRNFCLTEDNRFILIANQYSGNIVLCERNPDTGQIGEKLCDVALPNACYVAAVRKEF